jgi:6-pyruvoyltetrahydropterin/6-carboxytetrahydropterin synthase
MYTIVKTFHFCYGHRLMGHPGKCSRAHGHNAVLEVELAGEDLDERGMICDFADVKRRIEEIVDGRLDHRMILEAHDPLVPALRGAGEEPCVLDVPPTAENIARLIFQEARAMGLPVAAVRLWETPTSRAEYLE